jgi:hypothetical protein
MKWLHALVGYFTITALPFSPFAFASPGASVHYDGYVDTTTQNHTLMNNALASLLETCTSQSLSATQNHSDSGTALMKRVPGEIIEARQGVEAIPVYAVIITVLALVALGIIWVEGDDPVRGSLNDVEFLVEHSD